MKTRKKISEIFRKIVIGYVFYTFPLTLIAFAMIAFAIIPLPQSPASEEVVEQCISNLIASNHLYGIAVGQSMIWVSVAFLYSVTMFFSRNNREVFIKKLSGIKERDEREVQIVGKALRASYLTTMTILLFLLFASCFQMELSRKSADTVKPGEPRGTLSLGFGDESPNTIITQKKGYDFYYKYKGLPLSTPDVILILFVWQIVSFRVVARRALKVP